MSPTRYVASILSLLFASCMTAACAAPTEGDDADGAAQASTVDQAPTLEATMRKDLASAVLVFKKDARFVDGEAFLGYASGSGRGGDTACSARLTEPDPKALLPAVPAGDAYTFDTAGLALTRTTNPKLPVVWRLPMRNKAVASGKADAAADFVLECMTRTSGYVPDGRGVLAALSLVGSDQRTDVSR
jgi:hypothetical protein